ncbi:hypothetical protein RHMOL_Rhmol04G0361200 [Rhododendron molle]|uniref:Uncharacterized protein n=2 Tax=Rhododendron molle TaxID=49168 RepID=A0ACC0P912_RHOML|nr:hypothetical protein RHMOL_Rhmol06G0196400 [Rhododendron molle]KAI8561704.1 hypothetical protein RHMOL_Rhmol04G0361200 [Rhododendron molle]
MAMAMFETWTIEGSVSGVDDSNGGEGESWETTSAVGWERVGSSLERLGSTDEFPPDQTLDSVFLRIMENEKKTEKEKEKDWGGTNVRERCRFLMEGQICPLPSCLIPHTMYW